METITKQQIFKIIVGLTVTIGLYELVDYPQTSSALIATFIILLFSPTQAMVKSKITGQIYAQLVGVMIGIGFALVVPSVYLGLIGILAVVLTLPLWLKLEIPPLPLAIAAYIIFQADSSGSASIERVIVKLLSLFLAFVVAWIFSRQYRSTNVNEQAKQQFHALKHVIIMLLEQPSAVVQIPEPLSVAAKESLTPKKRQLVDLNTSMYELVTTLQASPESLPHSVAEELRYALTIHSDMWKQRPTTYHVSELALVSTWSVSASIAATHTYCHQVSEHVVKN